MLNIDINKDILSSFILSSLVYSRSTQLEELQRMSGKKVLIIGAGPSLNNHLIQKFIIEHSDFVILAADGATELCLQLNIIPDLIVTDLDGDIKSLIDANNNGSILLIHGHGDNMDKIMNLTSKFHNVIPTTQSFPIFNVYNFGGFTDGDRCVFLADEFNSEQIVLIGMDFDSSIGYYSKKKVSVPNFKRKKLFIGKNLIEILAHKSKSEIFNVRPSASGSLISGVNDYKLI